MQHSHFSPISHYCFFCFFVNLKNVESGSCSQIPELFSKNNRLKRIKNTKQDLNEWLLCGDLFSESVFLWIKNIQNDSVQFLNDFLKRNGSKKSKTYNGTSVVWFLNERVLWAKSFQWIKILLVWISRSGYILNLNRLLLLNDCSYHNVQ